MAGAVFALLPCRNPLVPGLSFFWLISPLSHIDQRAWVKTLFNNKCKEYCRSLKHGLCSVFDTNSFKKILLVENVGLPAQGKENRCKFYSFNLITKEKNRQSRYQLFFFFTIFLKKIKRLIAGFSFTILPHRDTINL